MSGTRSVDEEIPEDDTLPEGMSEFDYSRGSAWPDYMLGAWDEEGDR